MKLIGSISVVTVCLGACTPAEQEGQLPIEKSASAELGKADSLDVSLTRVDAPIGFERRTQGGRAIVTSAGSWVQYFGTEAPANVDFSREWVAFYGLGARSSGGFTATINALRNVPSYEVVVMATEEVSPGPGCAVTKNITFPYELAKFDIPSPAPTWAALDHTDTLSQCSVDECNPLLNTGCDEGEYCEPGLCLLHCSVDDPGCCEPAQCMPEPIHGECGDGSIAVCEIVPPECPIGLVLEVVNGCFGECVDPLTCLPPPQEVCGNVVCAPGTECCNPLDGICVLPGMACTF